jgi:hypothetical protein
VNDACTFLARLLQRRPWGEHWRFTDAPTQAPEFAVPRFDRTLSEYLNAVLDAGFSWRDHAALFLHVRASKPY